MGQGKTSVLVARPGSAPRLSSRHVVINDAELGFAIVDKEHARAEAMIDRIKNAYEIPTRKKENRHERRKRQAQSRRAR